MDWAFDESDVYMKSRRVFDLSWLKHGIVKLQKEIYRFSFYHGSRVLEHCGYCSRHGLDMIFFVRIRYYSSFDESLDR